MFIEGKLRTRQYQDKDQQTRYITEIIADEISMLGGRPQGTNEATDEPVDLVAVEAAHSFRQEPELDQLPF